MEHMETPTVVNNFYQCTGAPTACIEEYEGVLACTLNDTTENNKTIEELQEVYKESVFLGTCEEAKTTRIYECTSY